MRKTRHWIMAIGIVIVVVTNIMYRYTYYTISESKSDDVVYWTLSYNKALTIFALYNANDPNGIKGHKYYHLCRRTIYSALRTKWFQ